MAVVAAFEFEYLVSLREPACETNGRHRRFRAGIHESDFLDRWKRLAHQLRESNFTWVWRAEARTVPRRFLHGANDLRMRVAQNHRPPRAHVVDVLVPVDVPQP